MLAAARIRIRISMDGRGRWIDNVFIERLWRSLKYEDVYIKGYADGQQAKAGRRFVRFSRRQRRPDQNHLARRDRLAGPASYVPSAAGRITRPQFLRARNRDA